MLAKHAKRFIYSYSFNAGQSEKIHRAAYCQKAARFYFWELIMSLKKSLETNNRNKGQSIIEYMLLLGICIIGFLASTFFTGTLDNALEDHFDKVQSTIKVY
jgi:hypothetical protein